MKQLLIVLLGLLCAGKPLMASDDRNIVPAVLKAATVYRSGAELQHLAKAGLQQGNNELVIDGISNRIDMNSLRIGTDNKVTILSVEFSTDFLRPVQKSAAIKRWEDSLEIANKELARVQVLLKTNQELLELLKANKSIAGTQTGLSVDELTKMMDYYKVKTLALQNEMTEYRVQEIKWLDLTSKLNRQIKEEEQKNNKTIGKIVLQLFCPVAGSYDFNITYMTPTASWVPVYDLKVATINKPVSLSYKAKLVQATGFDWKQVKLALNTSIPNQNNNAPILKSWFLVYTNPVSALENALSGKANTIPGFADNNLQEVVVTGYSTRVRGTNTVNENTEPIYVVNGAVISAREFKKIDQRAIKDIQTLKDQQATAIYGARAAAGAIVVTLKDGLGDYVTVNDNELNVTYNIDLPYDVPSNGKEQNVVLKELDVSAVYQYYAAPRLDKSAYLLSEVPDWEKLNLLPGQANIIFENTFIGKTNIDPASTQDTLHLTLGSDKRVVVTREKLADFSAVKFLGSNKKQTFTWEITVRNNKKETIQMILKDQYPLSTNKDIEVELLQHDGASVNDETGVLTWKLQLAPGEVKKIRVSYSVKYPKDKMVNLN